MKEPKVDLILKDIRLSDAIMICDRLQAATNENEPIVKLKKATLNKIQILHVEYSKRQLGYAEERRAHANELQNLWRSGKR